MNRLAFSTLILLSLASGLAAQEMSSIQIFTEPSNIRYTVDGTRYIGPTVFTWPKGSKHIVMVEVAQVPDGTPGCPPLGSGQYNEPCSTRYFFQGWETNLPQDPHPTSAFGLQVVTADPDLKYLKARFDVEYKVWVALPPAPAGTILPCDKFLREPPPGGGHGGVWIGGVSTGGNCITSETALWMRAGRYPIEAWAFYGNVFQGYSFDGGYSAIYINWLEVKGPMIVLPMFAAAKQVRIYTEPQGLEVRVDRQKLLTMDQKFPSTQRPVRGHFDFWVGSKHILGATSPQMGLDGKYYVFEKWSNGGGQDMNYVADYDVNNIEVLTAEFVRGVPVTFTTAPLGLRVMVDGVSSEPGNSFAFKLGSTTFVSAPLEQTDTRGRKYSFKSWSNGGPATQAILAEEAQLETGIRMTANFELEPRYILQSSIPGLTMKIDGNNCIAPCRLDRVAGSEVHVSVPPVITVNAVTRHEFIGWGDSASPERTLTFAGDTHVLVAQYRTMHKLTAIADPSEGAKIHFSPASSDGFFAANTVVNVAVETKPGFKFRRWDGDASGTSNWYAATLSAPRTIRANLDKVPFVGPAGVKNAAGETPVEGVAPGSLITIFGSGLANRQEASEGAVFSPSLAGSYVMVGDRLLSLVFVSPEQINALLPSDLEPGTYSVTIQPERATALRTEVKVVRNAPGVFSNTVDGTAWLIAMHADGTAVTPESPARRDEVITLLGTGFGPYNRRPIDGFPVPASPSYNLVDDIHVAISGVIFTPEWAGAQPGFVGIAGARVRIPQDVQPGDGELKLIVNKVESNPVTIPIR